MMRYRWFGVVCIILVWAIPVRAGSVDMQGKDCNAADCHDTMQTKKAVHGPVAQGNCVACHEQEKEDVHTFTFSEEPNKLCQTCHAMQLKNFVHKPIQDGKCTACHDPHQSDHRYMLVKDPAKDLCLTCHKDEPFMKKKHLHGPVAAGVCILCHEAHSSWNAKLTIKKGRELCLFCHEDVDRRLATARHVHPPVRKDCNACHDPHASDSPMQVRGGKDKLCLTCHKDLAKVIQTSKRIHGATQVDDTCGNCHSGHASMLPRLLKKPLMDTCLSCHNKPIKSPDGKILTNMAELLKNNPDHHGPVRRADCTACHNPHASPNFRLLVKEYPEFFYAPFDLGNYDLCFQCHMRDAVLVKEAKGLTNFRHGNKNLHFVHVNRKDKGRTCRACHEVHASRNPKHIRDKVPFGSGGWEFDLNYQRTVTGGRCAPACHKPHEYVRGDNGGPPPTTGPTQPSVTPVDKKKKEAK